MGHAGLVVGRKDLAMRMIASRDDGQTRLSRFDDDFRRRLDFAIAETANDFENFAPSWERSATAAFVVIHGTHELDFVERIVAFASGRINFSSALGFAAWIAGTAFDAIRCPLSWEAASLCDATVFAQTLFDDLIHFQSSGHSWLREGKLSEPNGSKT